jgi:hypothetical protein
MRERKLVFAPPSLKSLSQLLSMIRDVALEYRRQVVVKGTEDHISRAVFIQFGMGVFERL